MAKNKKKVKPQDRALKKEIRKYILSMHEKNCSVNKADISSKFLKRFPQKSQYIAQIVQDYAAFLEQKTASQEPKVKRNAVALETNIPIRPSRPPEQPPGDSERNMPVGPSQPPEQSERDSELAVRDNSKPDNDIGQQKPESIILRDFKDYLGTNQDGASCTPSIVSSSPSIMPALEQQMRFLNHTLQEDQSASDQFSRNADEAVLLSPALSHRNMPSQFALLGHLTSPPAASLSDPRVMLNTNVPFSAFICGLQGSGKSHTTSCIIENCTLSSSALGTLRMPLSTLVLHFNEYSSNVSSRPSEAAFIASVMPEYNLLQRSIPVTVLVPPSNLHALDNMYSQIPNVQVRPFRLQPQHLNISAMLALMSLGNSDSIPLYMAQVTRVLREMAVNNGGNFDYIDFRSRLNSLSLDRIQTAFLNQRLDLLDSFLDLKGKSGGDYFADGGVTILDLSCPFMDRSTACILFRIAIDLFLHDHSSRGKVIVADEAHKYITNSSAANALTETFLNIVRQQRHLGVRLIISTQEPTISPQLIDLCSITIIHRFSSPEWYQAVRKHITLDDKGGGGSCEDALRRILSLRTGEALVFAPSAYLLDGNQCVLDAGHGTFQMMVRKRFTWDGGQTVMCVR